MRAYHDDEWGRPSHSDRYLFEMLLLEGAQAGLSWATILGKRDNYRRALDGFDPELIVGYDAAKLAELLTDPGIVRNRAQGRGHGDQCPGVPGHPAAARDVRRLPVGLGGWHTAGEPAAQHRRPARADRIVRSGQQRPEAARLHLRRVDDYL
jgi:hypothetical protein